MVNVNRKKKRSFLVLRTRISLLLIFLFVFLFPFATDITSAIAKTVHSFVTFIENIFILPMSRDVKYPDNFFKDKISITSYFS